MPNEITLALKKEAVEALKEKLQKSAAGVLVDYRGLTVEEDTKLRAKFREANVDYKVVKNTFMRFASNEIGFEAFDPFLNGPTSLAVSYDDPVAPAKILAEFAKENEKIEIKAGFVDGKVIDTAAIKELASLPSREVLVAKALGGLNAPISGFAGVLSGTLRSLVCVLNAVCEKQSA